MLIPPTIDAANITDVTKPMNDWLRTVPAGGLAELPAGAHYRIDGTLAFVGRDLSLVGLATFEHPPSTGDRVRSMFTVDDAKATFDGLTILGGNPNAGTGDAAYVAAREAQHGFNLIGAHQTTIRNVTVRDVFGDFVYCGLNKALKWCDTIIVEDVDFSGTGRQGISAVAVNNLRVRRFNIRNVRRTLIDIEPSSKDCGATDVWFTNGTFGAHRLNMLGAGGFNGGDVDTVVLANIKMTSAMTVTVPAKATRGKRTGFYFLNLTSTSPPYGTPSGVCMDFHDVAGATVTGCKQPLQVRSPTMHLAKFDSKCTDVVYDSKN